MKGPIIEMAAIALLAVSGAVGIEPAATSRAEGTEAENRSGEAIETFVLTPIQVESFSLHVPAEVCGPVTNNSCHAWDGHVESCYLPARKLDSSGDSGVPALAALLQEHISAAVGAWRSGAWPADGASVDVPLEQYASFEHLWLTYCIDLSESVGSCWLDGRGDPEARLAEAIAAPAARLDVEVFAGTRDARGYPLKSRL